MNPNLAGYYWAEQSNRQRLDDQAACGWLVSTAADAGSPQHAGALRRMTADGLAWAGRRLRQTRTRSIVRPIAVPGGTAG